MQKNKNRIIASAMLAAILLSALLLVFSFSAEAEDVSFGTYDYSHSGSAVNVTVGTAEVLSQYLESVGEQLASHEREFLNRLGKLSVSYSSVISTDRVKFDYSDGYLTVIAENYEYTGADGSVVYRPVSISAFESEFPISEGGVCSFEISAEEVSDFSCRVNYEADVEILSDVMTLALNLYHDVAKYVSEKSDFEECERLYKEYRIAKRVYDDAYREYADYLEKLGEYERDKAAYSEYEKALEQYGKDYNSYLEYLAELDRYERDMSAYEQYLSDMQTIKKQLSAIELVKVKMTDDRTLYGAVMGSTVDEVLGNETLLRGPLEVTDEYIIGRAGDATERVRALMTNYYSLGTEAERYNYYVVNYENFRDSFRELTATLDALYRYPRVRGTLIAEEKDKKYIILVAQLALVTNALTDGVVKDYYDKAAYGESWTIEGKTIKSILGGTYFEDTDSAAPLITGYPLPKNEPQEPSLVQKPTIPAEPKLPIEPTEVQHPGEPPAEVAAPTEPIAANSEVLRIEAELDSDYRVGLLEKFRDGECIRRSAPSESFCFKLDASVERTYSAQLLNVSFYGTDNSLIYSTRIEKGSSLSFEGIIPQKPTDEFGSYMFVGWKNSEGEPTSLLNVREDMSLYPNFEREPTYYNVTWIVDGKSCTERLVSDTVPVCPISTEKNDEGSYWFRFIGWDKPVISLCEDVTYVAVYEKCYTVSYSGGGATLADDGQTVTADAYGNFSGRLDISRLLPKISGERDLVIKCVFGELAFSFADVIEMQRLGVAVIETDIRQIGVSESRYCVNLLDSSGEPISSDIDVNAVLSCGMSDPLHAKMYFEDGGVRKYVGFSSVDGAVVAALTCGVTYKLVLEYKITVHESSSAQIVIGTEAARPGVLVPIEIKLASGMELVEVLVLDESGNVIKIENDGSFRMPYSNVSIAVKARVATYTVTYVASGKVVAVLEVEHGAVPTPPTPPVLEKDNLYSYEFLEWYPTSGPVLRDVTYTAIYARTLLPSRQEDDSAIKITPNIMRFVVLAAVACILSAAGVIPAAVIATVYAVRLKKRSIITKKGKKA